MSSEMNNLPARANSLVDRALNHPQSFDFFQLLRLLRRLQCFKDARALRNSSPYELAAITFSANPSLSFPAHAIDSIEQLIDASATAVESTGQQGESIQAKPGLRISMNAQSLIGSAGVLPFHYRELVNQRRRKKDFAMHAFYDFINQRSWHYSFAAWEKYRPIVAFEAKTGRAAASLPAANRVENDKFAKCIQAVAGCLGRSEAFHQRHGAWLNYAGIASQRRCNQYTLRNLIEHHFGLSATIRQFKGKWRTLSPDVLTRVAGMGFAGMNHGLGTTAILGSRCWVAQNLFEVEIEAYSAKVFQDYAPGSERLYALYEFIQHRAGIELEFDLSLAAYENQLSATRLGDKHEEPRLGWSTRLFKAKPEKKKILIKLTHQAMRPNEFR